MTDSSLESLWKHVLDHWDEDRAHAVFLESCERSEQLVEAAVRYRGMVGDRERGVVAEKKLRGVAMLAMTKLEVNRSSSPPPARHIGSILAIVFFIAAALGLLALYFDSP